MTFVIHVSRDVSVPLGIEPGDSVVLGRDSAQCQFVVRDISVSRRHCRLSVIGDRAQVEDLGSTNGTLVNGQRIETEQLSPGDVVEIGQCRIELL